MWRAFGSASAARAVVWRLREAARLGGFDTAQATVANEGATTGAVVLHWPIVTCAHVPRHNRVSLSSHAGPDAPRFALGHG